MKELIKPDGFVLEHPAIDVADPVAVAAWWCKNLGFTITKQKDDETHTTFLVDASGRVAMEMYRARTQPQAPDYASMEAAVEDSRGNRYAVISQISEEFIFSGSVLVIVRDFDPAAEWAALTLTAGERELRFPVKLKEAAA